MLPASSTLFRTADPMDETVRQSLETTLRSGLPLDLLSTYKGVPVRYKASIQQIQGDAVTVSTPEPEVVCLAVEREVVILGEGLAAALRAAVVEVQLARGIARLIHIRRTDTRLNDRLVVRVEPRSPLPVRLEAAGQRVAAHLLNISLGGLAVEAFPENLAWPLQLRTPVRLSFTLPAGPVELVGILSNVDVTAKTQRLGIAFPQDGQIQAIIRYVLERRVEILAELRVDYEARSASTATV